LAHSWSQAWLKEVVDAPSGWAQHRIRAIAKIPHVPKTILMDVPLLSTAVLARVALPCDSLLSDPPYE